MLKSWLPPGGTAAAAGEQQARRRCFSAHNWPNFPLGAGQAGLVWTLAQCGLLMESRLCSVPSQAYPHSYSCTFILATPGSSTEHQSVLLFHLLGIKGWEFGCKQTFPKGFYGADREFYGVKSSYCSHRKFYVLCECVYLNVLCLSKNGQFLSYPLPGCVYSSVLVHLTHLIQNSHQLFSILLFCILHSV